ncbi:immunoglobulin-like domain-containing protein [Paenibacillus agricola]|uniref:Atrophied bacterial Ig domain-containing protein n=1 Tax=Paenibacillus agricola TaxID=2716264 RepID=A0ABX0J1L1_9BACL|nr:immunoglobulin-like domain-containing protein [Paenibacillus agricola]NHN30155.1 hypothetical protein [Paenibacillus agricola]
MKNNLGRMQVCALTAFMLGIQSPIVTTAEETLTNAASEKAISVRTYTSPPLIRTKETPSVKTVTNSVYLDTVIPFIDEVADTSKPIILDTMYDGAFEVPDGHWFKDRVRLDSAATDINTVSLTKDGASVADYTLGQLIFDEGMYVLVVTDYAGNVTTLHFAIDRTNPVINGVTPGQRYNSSVTPTSPDTNIDWVSLRKDNQSVEGYTLGQPISDSGTYFFQVQDLAGNSRMFSFTIERVAPDINGVTPGQLSNTSITPTSTATDIETVSLTKDGVAVAGYTLGKVIRDSGTYVLVVTDHAGNAATVPFTIESNAPVVGGVTDGQLTDTSVTPASPDNDIETVSLTRDGVAVAGYMLGQTISDSGAYVLVVMNHRGNTTIVHFTIGDRAAPIIIDTMYDGAFEVPDGHWFKDRVRLDSAATDINTVSLTKDGASVADYTLGQLIFDEGMYVLVVTDYAGNATTLHFAIDRTNPVINGVTPGQRYNSGVTPTSPDTNIDWVSLRKDNQSVEGYTLGQPISDSGTYFFQVQDLAGNSRMFSFTIERVAPDINGVTPGQLSNTSITPTSTATDIETVSLTKDGVAVAGYTLGKVIRDSGTYVLVVTDHAGNAATVPFTIESNAPVVGGVTDGQLTDTSVTPASPDNDIETVSLTRDGVAVAGYTLGQTISDSGAYVLVVMNHRGNTTIVHFTIGDRAAPIIIDTMYDGAFEVPDGHWFNDRIRLDSAATDINTVSLTKDGVAVADYALGQLIFDEGMYVLVVTDHTGNVTTLHFGIDRTNPVVNGVTAGQRYNSSVTPTSPDTNIGWVSLRKDNQIVEGYTLGQPISDSGTYFLQVEDLAGHTRMFSFIIDIDVQISDAQAVDGAKSVLVITFSGSDTVSSVTQNVTFPTTGTNGTAIAWVSDNTDLITTTGTVTRPVHGAGNATVTLTATITKGTETVTKTFALIVVAAPDVIVTDLIAPIVTMTNVTTFAVGTEITGVQSNEVGTLYLVSASATVTNKASLDALFTAGTAIRETVSTANTDISLSTTGLTIGEYKVYAVDAVGNVSNPSSVTIILTPVPQPFIISGGTLSNTGGIKATVTVTSNSMGSNVHTGNEVVIFQLMKGEMPVSIVALETDIQFSEALTAYFNVTGSDYKVDVFVVDSYSNSFTDVGNQLAKAITLE